VQSKVVPAHNTKMAIKNVAVIGANGSLGSWITRVLLDAGFTVTALTRKSSEHTFPAGVRSASVEDDYPYSEMLEVFRGQDAVIAPIGLAALPHQSRMIDAAADAGVQRFVPNEFSFPPAVEDGSNPAFAYKYGIRQHCESKLPQGLSWTGVANAAFFEWGIETGYLRLDVHKRTQILVDGGDHHFPATTFRGIAAAVAGVLKHPEETKNRMVWVQSFATTLNELRGAIEKAGAGNISVAENLDSKTYIKEQNDLASTGQFENAANAIFALCTAGLDFSGNWIMSCSVYQRKIFRR
jgi:uncharacterized protein YbjT (DUF2867 family)